MMMHPSRLLFLFLVLPWVLASSDVWLLLEKVKPALQGKEKDPRNAQLVSWNASTPLCLWRGLRWSTPDGVPLRCHDKEEKEKQKQKLLVLVTSIRLPAAALGGHLPPELGAFSALQSLYLGANSLWGPIPLELGNAPALSVLDLAGNALSGALPVSLWNLCDSRSSSIYGGGGGGIMELRLHGNALTGAIPAPAGPNTTCDALRVLDLGANRFSGEFPNFVAEFRGLRRLDLSYNNLSGKLPPGFAARFSADSFVGNNFEMLRQTVSRRLLAGMVIGVVVAASLCIIAWCISSSSRWRRAAGGEVESSESQGGRLVVFDGGEHLTLEDVLNATGQVVEKASYCTVYKAKLPGGGGGIELRLLRQGQGQGEGGDENLMTSIGRARHDNLVPLRAFYQGRRGDKLKLLVYDLFPHSTTLHHLLLNQSQNQNMLLTWPRRHKIALGVARALAYLHDHESSSSSSVHGNVRSSTVLVDDLFVPRLQEYAMHRLLLPSAADAMLAAAKSDGYKAPELNTMTKCSARTDVYAFGILLLQLLLLLPDPPATATGLVKAAVMEDTPLEDLLDSDLLNNHTTAVQPLLKLAMGCCAPVPAARPTMPDVVRQLQDLYSPADSTPTIFLP